MTPVMDPCTLYVRASSTVEPNCRGFISFSRNVREGDGVTACVDLNSVIVPFVIHYGNITPGQVN
jgi:hypothetical protein